MHGGDAGSDMRPGLEDQRPRTRACASRDYEAGRTGQESAPMNAYWDIRQLSAYLNVKPSTLYAWVAQGKIPCVRIHGLIRFRLEEIDTWIAGFQRSQTPVPSSRTRKGPVDIETLIASAKRAVYTSGHGETRPRSSLIEKEEHDGAREA